MLNAHQLIFIAIQIGRGLQHLHRRRILHRDVATRNCLWVDRAIEITVTVSDVYFFMKVINCYLVIKVIYVALVFNQRRFLHQPKWCWMSSRTKISLLNEVMDRTLGESPVMGLSTCVRPNHWIFIQSLTGRCLLLYWNLILIARFRSETLKWI